jgi:xanthine dehydrogenase accessory factor
MNVQADDIEVLASAQAWLQAGQQVALATVIRTWGSSPRPPGSLMAMNDAGRFVGSVSGGCIEDNLVERYRRDELSNMSPTFVDFGVDRLEASRMGLPCGGRLELLVEELSDPHAIGTLLSRLQNGELVARQVDLDSGEVSLLRGEGGCELQVFEAQVIKTFGPAWQLLLIGDGQLARHLAAMALQLDYRVTICDPRETFESANPIDSVHYTRAMPDEAVEAIGEHTRCAIVTLAHDPRQDDLGLSAALETNAFYVGALGSTRSAQARHERLQSLGYNKQQLERIHGPAGLAIGSKRPAEIAVSILAQITAIRNGASVNVQQPGKLA